MAHVSLLPLAALYNQTLEKKRFECHFNECLHFKFTFEKIDSNLKYHWDMNLVGHSIKLCEARRVSQKIRSRTNVYSICMHTTLKLWGYIFQKIMIQCINEYWIIQHNVKWPLTVTWGGQDQVAFTTTTMIWLPWMIDIVNISYCHINLMCMQLNLDSWLISNKLKCI